MYAYSLAGMRLSYFSFLTTCELMNVEKLKLLESESEPFFLVLLQVK
jgi:hypothetical protein